MNTNPNFTPSGLAYTPYSGFTGFSGTVDDVRIWNLVRSAAEIAAARSSVLNGGDGWHAVMDTACRASRRAQHTAGVAGATLYATALCTNGADVSRSDAAAERLATDADRSHIDIHNPPPQPSAAHLIIERLRRERGEGLLHARRRGARGHVSRGCRQRGCRVAEGGRGTAVGHHVRDFARAGAPIFGAAPVVPAGVRDYEARDEFAALVRELWDGPRPLIRQTPLSAALKEIEDEKEDYRGIAVRRACGRPCARASCSAAPAHRTTVSSSAPATATAPSTADGASSDANTSRAASDAAAAAGAATSAGSTS